MCRAVGLVCLGVAECKLKIVFWVVVILQACFKILLAS